MNTTTCREARAIMSLKLDAEVSETDDRRLRCHLDACADCAGQWAHLCLLTRELEMVETVAAPRDFVARVMARVPAAATRRTATTNNVIPLVVAAILLGAISLSVVALLGVLLGLFNLPYLTLLVGDALRGATALSAVLALPRALLAASTDVFAALASSPWSAVASGCSALSAVMLLAWLYVVTHWRGVPLMQVLDGEKDSRYAR